MSAFKTKPVKANQLAIKALRPRAEKYEVGIEGHRGLVIRVWPSGEKTYLYRHRQDGQLRRIALKAADLAGAVREWSAERDDARKGEDIAARRQAERGAKKLARLEERRDPLFSQLVERYLEEYAKPRKRSWRSDQNRLNKYAVPAWEGVKAKAIKRSDVHALVHKIARKRPIQANRLLAVVRKVFSFGVDAGVFEDHPCLRMTAPAPERARSRVLNDGEIRAMWEKLVSPVLRDPLPLVLRLQLLTGCRIGEVVGARGEEFDLRKAVWLLPAERAKNKQDHAIPLSSMAVELLRDHLPANGLLFPGRSKKGHVTSDVVSHDLRSAIDHLGRNSGIEPFITHDLRRTLGTRLAEMGFSKDTRQRVLNHKDTSVTGKHYDLHDHLNEKRTALDAWARKIEQILSGKEATVTPLRRARKAD